jgi:hypothetical protein
MNTITINGEQIEVSDEMLEQIKQASGKEIISTIESYKDFIGKSWFIRAVTYHTVGKIVKIVGNLFILENASWIPDSGRFMNALKTGELNEIEPVGTCIISLSAIVDMFPWNHALPKLQK